MLRTRLTFAKMLAAMFALGLTLSGCSLNPLASSTPLPPNTLVYDAPVSLTIKNGTALPGTAIAYGGKTDTGAGQVLIAGLAAPKQTGDTVDWQGSPVSDVTIDLSTRVATFDQQSITLVGTAHIVIKNVSVKPGGSAGTVLMEFNAPVTASLQKNEFIPGSNIAYGGSTAEGAKFLGVDGYPYRKTLDSLQYVGRINSKVFLELNLRVTSYSDTSVLLVGTADIKIES